MRKAIKAILIPVGLSSLTMTVPALAADVESLDSHVEFLGEFIFFKRTNVHGHAIAKNHKLPQCCTTNDDTKVTVCEPKFVAMTTKDVVEDFCYEPGYRVGVTFNINPYRSIEARYMDIQEWEGRETVTADGKLYFPFADAHYAHDFIHADKAVGKYDSHLRDAELNYWVHWTPRRGNYYSFSTMGGLRYSEIKENFKLTYHRHSQRSHYKIRANNHLYGVQLGVNLQWNPTHYLSWDATVKGAAIANDATQKTFLGDYNDRSVLRHFTAHCWNNAWLGDASLTLGYQPWTYLNFHIGYQFLYYTGIALAPEQLSGETNCDAGLRVYHKGDPMYNGFFVGMILAF